MQKGLKEDLPARRLRERLSGNVEVDETYLTAGEEAEAA